MDIAIVKTALEDPETFYWNYLSNDTAFQDGLSDPIPDDMPFCGVCAYLYFYKQTDAIHKYKKKYLPVMEEECNKVDKYNISSQISQLAKLCPFVRDLAFAVEKKILDACETLDDFERFIERDPTPYKEYLLYAKYQLSNILNSRFDEYDEVLREYPQSDIIDVKNILSRCETINGLSILWSHSALPLHQAYIKGLLNSMTQIDDSILGHACWVNLQPLSKQFVYGLLLDSKYIEEILSQEYFPAYILYKEVYDFLEVLNEKTGLQFAIPSIDMLDRLADVEKKSFRQEQYEWCIDGQNHNILLRDTEDGRWFNIKDSNNYFATLRLVLNK